MKCQNPYDDEYPTGSGITVLSLPFSDISCYKVGSINKVYNETKFSSAYQKVLEILLKINKNKRHSNQKTQERKLSRNYLKRLENSHP
ncbi:hypothetical protein WDU94_006036 [Cyamophila willieti]